MKSFRFYWRYQPAIITPSKRREEYSADELAAFQREFQRLWKRRQRQLLPLWVGLLIWVGGLGSMAFLGPDQAFEIVAIAALIFLAALAYAAFFIEFPRCPACSNGTDEPPGRHTHYCPACGESAIDEGTWLSAPCCLACGINLRVGKERKFKIRYCTTCGIPLDDRGV